MANDPSKSRRVVVSVISWAFLLLAVSWVIHAPGFSGDFYLDSAGHITHNQRYHVTELSLERLDTALRHKPGEGLYRPLSSLTLALNYYFLGQEPAGFRQVNVVIHLLSALALLFMFSSLFRAPRLRRQHPLLHDHGHWLLLAAITLWVLHPIQTNVVTYVIQRMASLAGLFIFLTVGCYLRTRLATGRARRGWAAGALVSLVLGMASKENAVVAVPLCLAVEWLLFSDWGNFLYRRNVALSGFLLLVALAVGLAVKGPSVLAMMETYYEARDFSMMERLLTQSRIQFWYLLVLLVPDPRILQLESDIALSTGLFSPPETFFTLLLLLGAGVFAVLVRKRSPLVSLGILWFFLAQLLESTILPLELFFEHRMYVPSVFFYLGISALLFRGSAALQRRGGSARFVLTVILVLIAGLLSMATHARNGVWGDPEVFALDAYAKAPEKSRPNTMLARLLRKKAEQSTDPAQRMALLEQAIEFQHVAIDAKPIDPSRQMYNLALLYYRIGRFDEFERIMLEVGEGRNTFRGKALGAYALHQYNKGHPEAALEYMEQAVEADPSSPLNNSLYSRLLLENGRVDEAITVAQRVVDGYPEYAEGWFMLGRAREALKENGAAREAYEKAVALDPEELSYRNAMEVLDAGTKP